ncbi:hypothetical protein Acr_13g0002160 [Actinidia rufa]|uniref:DDE Tnp4 domain-containing protein n=1 Tax=Actinidia rufa TaxID=165716 RepID=A0A7J0FJE4_9ERIC|nr:hypothetical protein Acr_13g0002160 [Actinidia rufa]
MPPLKKTKKPKRDSKKLKKRRSVSSGPTESKAIDSDWWENFWHKNSPISGSNVISDEEEGFKYFFRVSKKTFDYICSLVRLDLVSRPPSGWHLVSPKFLWGLPLESGQSTVSQVTWRFIEALEERAKHHLKWPDSNKMQEIKSKFEASFGLPNCCGAIDATHIVMTLPAVETSDDWCDQEKNYSMFLQVIVDNEMRFLDIVTGWPGRMPISRMLKCSGFYKLCYSGNRLNGNARTNSERAEIREFIVGGVNYPLLSWLITPYESSGLSAAESKFNAIHEAARSLAMKALAQLKGSWRILNKVMWRPDKQKLPSIILVCCLLHNIIIDCGDNLRPDVALSGHHDLGYTEQCCKQVDPLGRTTRENLVQHLQLSKQKALPN